MMLVFLKHYHNVILSFLKLDQKIKVHRAVMEGTHRSTLCFPPEYR